MTLSKGKLTIHFKVIENEKDKQPFCFGYHPYLEIDGKPLEEIEIKTDITSLLDFDQVFYALMRTSYPFIPFRNDK